MPEDKPTQTALGRREIFMANGSYKMCDLIKFNPKANHGVARDDSGREFDITQMYGTWGEVRLWM